MTASALTVEPAALAGAGTLPVIRHSSPDLHNRIANDAAVKPYFGYADDRMDFAELCTRPQEYALLSHGDDAAAIFEWSAPGVWQGHTMFLPSCRGRRAIEAGQAMCDWMLSSLADMLWGQTPLQPPIFRRVRWFNRQIGFHSAGIGFHHVAGDVELFIRRN